MSTETSSPFAHTIAVSGVREVLPMGDFPKPPREASGRSVSADVTVELGASFTPARRFPSDAPLPQRIGAYRVVGRVGDGGMGVVYRAVPVRDAPGGDAPVEVALKTVRARGADGLASLRREIHALSRVVHPGVVRILDQGIDSGRPYYTMELIEGPTLARHLQTPGRFARLHETLEILRRLCETLGFLHGAGIVHRDLTPRNVVVRPDGTPVLVDFGLALGGGRRGRDALDADATVGGTLHYIAPEQLRGDPIDPRADLYALGCMIYEAITGQPPFDGSNVTDIAKGHLLEEPQPPSLRVPDLDPRLDALVLRLLRKRREERIGYAEDVAAALAPFCGAGSAERAAAPAERARPYVYRPGFVGREALLAQASRLFDAALAGRGARVLVRGEGGVGKTRLLGELANRARQAGFLVVASECSGSAGDRVHASSGAGSLEPWRPVLEALASLAQGSVEIADRLVGSRGPLLAPFAPALAALPGQSAYADTIPRPPQEARDDLLAALADSISRLAGEAPLVILLDDAQDADELSLDLLAALTPEFFANRRALLIASYRSEDRTPVLDELARDPRTTVLDVGRFDDDAVDRMAGEMLALDELPSALRSSLEGASVGNPFFVSELLRLALDEGWLTRAVGGSWELIQGELVQREGIEANAVRLPRSVSELCERRLGVLSATTRGVAEALAVVGRDADLALLARVSALTQVEAMDALVDLTGRALVDEAGERFRIVHQKVRDVAYAALSPARRVDLHRRAAAELERRAETHGPIEPAVLAHHWAQAGERMRAVDCLDEAGLRAIGRAAHADAAGFFKLALASSPADARVASWHRRASEAHFALGHLGPCQEHAAAALAALGHRLPTTRRGWAGELLLQLGRQAAHVFSRGSPRADARAEEAALAASIVAMRSYFAQETLPLLASSLLAVNLAERAGVARGISLPYAQLGFLAGACKLRARSAAYFARARSGAELANDTPARAAVINCEALLHACQGRFGEAGDAANQALALSGRRVPQEREVAHVILAHVEYLAARYDRAIHHGERLFESAHARQNAQHEAFGQFAIARALLRLERFADALERLEAVRASAAHPKDALVESICGGLSAQALSGLGAHDTAEAMADAAMAAVARADQAFSLADGYEGAAEVYLDAWARARREGRAPSPVWRRHLASAGAAMRRFAALFPMGEPRYLLHVGRVNLLNGATRRAAWALRLARSRALDLGMPFEAARADALLTMP